MKKDEQFHRDMQRYIAVTTIGPSSLRNQGSTGVIKAAQDYLAGQIDLGGFCAKDERKFLKTIDAATENLRRKLPRGAQNWGAARKACNLFLRDICYNRYLCQHYGLEKSEEWMELPLDGLVANALKRIGDRGGLPPWPGLNRLTPEISAKYQIFAKVVAAEQGISRVHLDMRLWTTERERNRK